MLNEPDFHHATLDYERESDLGKLYVQHDNNGLTIIASPAGWEGRRLPAVVYGGVAIGLPAWIAFWELGPRVPSLYQLLIKYGVLFALWLVALCLLAYVYHFAKRRVRIDVDEMRLRRLILSPFGRWEKSWRVRDIQAIRRRKGAWLFRIIRASRDTARMGERSRQNADFYQLFAVTYDHGFHLLLDSSSLKNVAVATEAQESTLSRR